MLTNRLPEAGLALMAAFATANQRGVDAVARDVIAHRVWFDESGEGYSNPRIEPPS